MDVMSDVATPRTNAGWLTEEGDENVFQRYKKPIPVRDGAYPLSRASDPEHKKPVQRALFHSRVFNLHDPEENKQYEESMQAIYDSDDGAEFISCDIHPPTDKCGTWTAFLQWRTAEILPPSQQGK